jgi:tetratricopeptide (TPR) repeat protein
MIKKIGLYTGVVLAAIIMLYFLVNALKSHEFESGRIGPISPDPTPESTPKSIQYDPFATTLAIIKAEPYLSQGWNWYDKKEYDKAISFFNQTLEINPQYALAFAARGLTWQKKGHYDDAINDGNKALELEPDKPAYLNNLAWILATCPNMRMRDGKRAVELALKAAKLTEWKKGYILDTLAASYAQSGDFPSAIKTQEKAIQLLQEESLKRRLELYKQKKAYTE